MAGKALGYRDILTSLFTEGDAPKAIRLTIERNPRNAYSFYKFVRQKLIGDDAHRHPAYLQRMRHFQHVHFSPQDPQWDRINTLMEGSLRDQYRMETSKKPIHPGLPEIRCMFDAFYDYKMPDNITKDAIGKMRESREMKHVNPPNISNIQMILSRAREWRIFQQNPWNLVACASILCGRRTQEIVRDLEWEKESDYVIRVRGLCKQDDADGSIPILVRYEDFDALMKKIRETELPMASSTNRLKPAMMRLFGQWYPHGHRRNIYCEAAYRLRHESQYFPDVSKIMWFDKALCHSDNVIHQASNLTYQTLTFDERE